MLVNFEVIGVASENYLRANDVWKLDNLLKYRIAAVIIFAMMSLISLPPNCMLTLRLHSPSLLKLWLATW